jgi:glucokinase
MKRNTGKHYIGVDIGGTNIALGIVDETGLPVHVRKIPTEVNRGSDLIILAIGTAIREMIHELGVKDLLLSGAGVGVPGFVDHERGISVQAVNLGWHQVPLAEKLEKELALPVFINNDVRMYIYGESVVGVGKGFHHILGVTLGTGMAAAVVNHGQLYYGSGNRAGEIGHIPIDGIEYTCACGLQGCLETVVSANGIVRQAKDAISEGKTTILQEWFPQEQLSHLTAADISRAYDTGDAVAQQIMVHTGTMLGKGLVAGVVMFSPDVIVIGGGAAKAGERLLAPMRAQLHKTLLPIYYDNLQFKTAQWLDEAGIIGSAMYAKERMKINDIK